MISHTYYIYLLSVPSQSLMVHLRHPYMFHTGISYTLHLSMVQYNSYELKIHLNGILVFIYTNILYVMLLQRRLGAVIRQSHFSMLAIMIFWNKAAYLIFT